MKIHAFLRLFNPNDRAPVIVRFRQAAQIHGEPRAIVKAMFDQLEADNRNNAAWEQWKSYERAQAVLGIIRANQSLAISYAATFFVVK